MVTNTVIHEQGEGDNLINKKVWDATMDATTYNDKQLCMYMMLYPHDEMDLILAEGRNATPLLFVRDEKGILSRASASTSAYTQKVHGHLSSLARTMQDKDLDNSMVQSFIRWIRKIPEVNTWHLLEKEAAAAYRQLLVQWKTKPQLEWTTHAALVRDTDYIGFENGVFHIPAGQIIPRDQLKGIYVKGETPWEFDPDLWETGGESQYVDHFFPKWYYSANPELGLVPEWQRKQYEAWKQLAWAFFKRTLKRYLAMITIGDAGKSTMLEILEYVFPEDVAAMEAHALVSSQGGSNPSNDEIDKLATARLAYIEEPDVCSPALLRKVSAAPQVRSRQLYAKAITQPVRGMIVILGNPDNNKKHILDIGNMTAASDATAARGRFIPLDQVPKSAQVTNEGFINNRENQMIFGHRFLRLVQLMAKQGDPGESEAMAAEKTRQRVDSQPEWMKEIIPNLIEPSDNPEDFVCVSEIYAVFQVLYEQSSPDWRKPHQARVIDILSHYVEQEWQVKKEHHRVEVLVYSPKSDSSSKVRFQRKREWTFPGMKFTEDSLEIYKELQERMHN